MLSPTATATLPAVHPCIQGSNRRLVQYVGRVLGPPLYTGKQSLLWANFCAVDRSTPVYREAIRSLAMAANKRTVHPCIQGSNLPTLFPAANFPGPPLYTGKQYPAICGCYSIIRSTPVYREAIHRGCFIHDRGAVHPCIQGSNLRVAINSFSKDGPPLYTGKQSTPPLVGAWVHRSTPVYREAMSALRTFAVTCPVHPCIQGSNY